MSKNWEVASIICETVAFFLVTTELYGHERLEALTNRVRGFFSSKGDSMLGKLGYLIFYLCVGGFIIWFDVGAYNEMFVEQKDGPIWVVLVSAMLICGTFSLLLLLGFTIYDLISGLITRFKLEGLLLIFGAFLFLLSKALQIALLALEAK